jgi:hypothetical protein
LLWFPNPHQAIIGSIGDTLIQKYEAKKKVEKGEVAPKYDYRRLLVFCTVAAIYSAPVVHLWFGYINELPYPLAWGKNGRVLAMIFLDQSIGAIVLNTGFYFTFEAVSRQQF